MPPSKTPNKPAANQGRRFEWSKGSGLQNYTTVKGTAQDIENIALQIQASGSYNNELVASFRGQVMNGRGELEIMPPMIVGGGGGGSPSDLDGVIEELYGQDQVKDIEAAPIFDVEDAKNLIVARNAARDAEDEIGSWTDRQKLLYRMIAHGQTSYFETGFVYRRSIYRSTQTQANVSFENINKVVTTPPVLSSRLTNLIANLPSGEWLQKPPQIQYGGRGVYQLTQEWWWAEKWSVIYGGTKNFGVTITP
jgi:hypothetical protein